MIKKPFVRDLYNYDAVEAGNISGLECKDKSLTKQSEKDDSDINVIVRRILNTGQLPEIRAPRYGDFTGINNFQQAMDAVTVATNEFMKLPAELRARLQNSPQKFLEYVNDAKNVPEMIELGLFVESKPPPEAPERASKEEAKA